MSAMLEPSLSYFRDKDKRLSHAYQAKSNVL